MPVTKDLLVLTLNGPKIHKCSIVKCFELLINVTKIASIPRYDVHKSIRITSYVTGLEINRRTVVQNQELQLIAYLLAIRGANSHVLIDSKRK